MKNKLAIAFFAMGLVALAQQDHAQHDMNARGDHVMGFSHEKTTHHFHLAKDGGAIEVEAKDPADTTSRDEIRGHLTHIAKKFAAGDFNAPILIHEQNPPGVPVMQDLQKEIDYRYEPTNNGARVRITTKNPKALSAIHEFLRFQIKEHATGDSLNPELF